MVGAGSPFSRHASWTLYHFLSHFPTSSTSLSLSPSSKPSHLDFSQLPPPNYLLQFTYLWLQYLLPPQQWNIYNFSVWFSIMKIEINWTKLHIILLLFFYIKKHYYLNLSHDFFFLFVHVRLISSTLFFPFSFLTCFSFHNSRELNSSKILDKGYLWLVPLPLTLAEWWLMLVRKLWFFLVGGLKTNSKRNYGWN